MKSKRAEEFINNRSELIDGLEWMVDASTARRAVELAELDAEEEIEMLKARAVCAFDSLDFTELMTAECVQDFDNVKCRLRGLFLQKLNER